MILSGPFPKMRMIRLKKFTINMDWEGISIRFPIFILFTKRGMRSCG